MWPEDDDEDDLDGFVDEEEGDDEDIVARVETAFREERAWIRTATDTDALRELRVTYKAQIADEVLVGVAALRAGDLVELIDSRLADLKAARLQRERSQLPPTPVREQASREHREREAEERRAAERANREREDRERVRRERAKTEREAQERARKVDTQQRAAAARLANAKAAEIEARAALVQAQAARAARAPARPTTASPPATSAPRVGPSPLERAVTKAIDGEGGSQLAGIEQADRAALTAAGWWPPMGPPRDSVLWSPYQDWPKDWTLTGIDLASLRGRLGVTQAVMAGHLGVETGEVARAEAKVRERVRPALQVALKRALVEFLAAHAPRTPPTASPEALPSWAEASGTPGPAVLTGADLARYREAQAISQREAAERFGVAHGTVAKAELLPAQPLGERLQMALQAALRQ